MTTNCEKRLGWLAHQSRLLPRNYQWLILWLLVQSELSSIFKNITLLLITLIILIIVIIINNTFIWTHVRPRWMWNRCCSVAHSKSRLRQLGRISSSSQSSSSSLLWLWSSRYSWLWSSRYSWLSWSKHRNPHLIMFIITSKIEQTQLDIWISNERQIFDS